MKYLYIIIFVFISSIGYSQVGIGTVTPLQDLHIAGDGTIRIDSHNSTNNPLHNNGVDLAPVFADGKGDLTLDDGSGSTNVEPFDILKSSNNFIPDNPHGLDIDTGTVVNNDTTVSFAEDVISNILITVPQEALIEVKFGVTVMIEGSDLSVGPPVGPPYADITYDTSIKIGLYFVVDIDSDGILSPVELSKKYGLHGQFYETKYGGIQGYSYMNSDAYLTIPEGSHTLYFYGVVGDLNTNYTSVGFGGHRDYLRIRVYN